MKTNRKTRLIVLTLVFFSVLVPTTALADNATNERITDLSVTFEGSGNSTLITIDVGLNTIAQSDTGLIIKFYIDAKQDANNLGETTAGSTTFTTSWDITQWPEGVHVLIAVLKNPSLEVNYDNKADNELRLPFTTQSCNLASILDVFCNGRYVLSQSVRHNFNGYLEILDTMPMYGYFVVILFIIIIAVVVAYARRHPKKTKKAGYYAQQPYYQARNYYRQY